MGRTHGVDTAPAPEGDDRFTRRFACDTVTHSAVAGTARSLPGDQSIDAEPGLVRPHQ